MTQFTNLYGKEAGLGLQILIYLRPKTNSNPIDLKAKHSVNFANPSVINLPRHFIILHLLKDAGLPVLYVSICSTVFVRAVVLHNTLSYTLILLYLLWDFCSSSDNFSYSLFCIGSPVLVLHSLAKPTKLLTAIKMGKKGNTHWKMPRYPCAQVLRRCHSLSGHLDNFG